MRTGRPPPRGVATRTRALALPHPAARPRHSLRTRVGIVKALLPNLSSSPLWFRHWFRHSQGVGNWVADEVLYQAAIHPEAPCRSLSQVQSQKLHTAVLCVINIACAANADAAQFPPEWLFHYRWGKGAGGARVPGGGAITFLTVGGRTSAVVLPVQRKGDGRTEDADDAKAEKGGMDGQAKPRVRAKAGTKRAAKASVAADGDNAAEAGVREEKAAAAGAAAAAAAAAPVATKAKAGKKRAAEAPAAADQAADDDKAAEAAVGCEKGYRGSRRTRARR